jgi:hypothetical protein
LPPFPGSARTEISRVIGGYLAGGIIPWTEEEAIAQLLAALPDSVEDGRRRGKPRPTASPTVRRSR